MSWTACLDAGMSPWKPARLFLSCGYECSRAKRTRLPFLEPHALLRLCWQADVHPEHSQQLEARLPLPCPCALWHCALHGSTATRIAGARSSLSSLQRRVIKQVPLQQYELFGQIFSRPSAIDNRAAACRDVIESHDSVAVVLYHRGMRAFLLVRQFRPALYATKLRAANAAGADVNIPLADGFTCELCAGIVDKAKSLAEIAREEIEEECGYAVAASEIREIATFASSVGVQGAAQTLFYAEVDDSCKLNEHGGVAADGEAIELLALPLENVDAFVVDGAVAKTSGAMFGLVWGLNFIKQQSVSTV